MSENIKGIGKMSYHERKEAIELLTLYNEEKMTELAKSKVYDDGAIDVEFNPNSGCVFLIDEEYNCFMKNGEELDLFIYTPYKGVEGFFDEVMDEFMDLHPDDQDYMLGLATDELREKYPVLKEGAFKRFGGNNR